jgi:hypothetical protein
MMSCLSDVRHVFLLPRETFYDNVHKVGTDEDEVDKVAELDGDEFKRMSDLLYVD